MIAVSNKFTKFVVPNFRIAVESFDLSVNRFHTAGSFRCISSDNRRYGSLATQRKGLASFVVSLPQTFAHMPNFSKSSKAVQGTVSAPKKYSTLKSEERQFTQRLYDDFLQKTFAEIENVCIFVVQNRRNRVTHNVHTTRLIRRCPSSASTDVVASVLQNLTGATLSFLHKPILSTLNF